MRHLLRHLMDPQPEVQARHSVSSVASRGTSLGENLLGWWRVCCQSAFLRKITSGGSTSLKVASQMMSLYQAWPRNPLWTHHFTCSACLALASHQSLVHSAFALANLNSSSPSAATSLILR